MPDIDIDFADRNMILSKIRHVPATLEDGRRHNTGVYTHNIPTNPLTQTAALNYKQAEERGYLKLDFLNVGIYKDIRSEEHLNELLNKEPLWDLLEQDDFVNLLFHVNGHGSILRSMKPRTIAQLAAVLAMIRPAKRYLIGKDWTTVMMEVWTPPEGDEYYFKKSHATAYAAAVVVQMNLICEKISYEYS